MQRQTNSQGLHACKVQKCKLMRNNFCTKIKYDSERFKSHVSRRNIADGENSFLRNVF